MTYALVHHLPLQPSLSWLGHTPKRSENSPLPVLPEEKHPVSEKKQHNII